MLWNVGHYEEKRQACQELEEEDRNLYPLVRKVVISKG